MGVLFGITDGLWATYRGHGYFHRHFSSWPSFLSFPKTHWSPFTRFAQASVRNHLNGVRAGHQTEPYEVNTNESDIKGAQNFLDKAAVMADPEADTRNRWRLCTVTQYGHPQLHSPSPLLSSQPSSSAKQTSWTENSVPTSQFQQILSPSSASSTPSFLCSAEVFTCAGQLECFYDEATDGTRSISGAMFLSEIGIGSSFSTAIVKIIQRATGGEEKGLCVDCCSLQGQGWCSGSVRSESVFEIGDGG
uniref:Uncharacterized protein n=1 Tax=Salix viminalis TaxID=40686 RepID=A0A6N2LDT3_SALVM